MSETFTDEDMVNALLKLSARPIIMAKSATKKMRKTLIRENRRKHIKDWHEKQRKLKAVKRELSARISARMKVTWAKRKAQGAN